MEIAASRAVAGHVPSRINDHRSQEKQALKTVRFQRHLPLTILIGVVFQSGGQAVEVRLQRRNPSDLAGNVELNSKR